MKNQAGTVAYKWEQLHVFIAQFNQIDVSEYQYLFVLVL